MTSYGPPVLAEQLSSRQVFYTQSVVPCKKRKTRPIRIVPHKNRTFRKKPPKKALFGFHLPQLRHDGPAGSLPVVGPGPVCGSAPNPQKKRRGEGSIYERIPQRRARFSRELRQELGPGSQGRAVGLCGVGNWVRISRWVKMNPLLSCWYGGISAGTRAQHVGYHVSWGENANERRTQHQGIKIRKNSLETRRCRL